MAFLYGCELGGTNRYTPVPYDILKFITFWDWEFTQGAGYLNIDVNAVYLFVVTTVPATLVLRPRAEFDFCGFATNGYSAMGRCSDYSQASYLRLRNSDNSKWAKLEGDTNLSKTVFTCSNSGLDFEDEWTSQHYASDFYRGIMSVTNSLLKIIVNNYWLSGSSTYNNNQTSQSVALPFTEDTEKISHELVFEFTYTGIKATDNVRYYYPAAGIPSTFFFNYTNFELETDDSPNWGDIDADQDNTTAPPLVDFPINNVDGHDDDFEAVWDYNTSAYITWWSSAAYLYDPDDNAVWAAKLSWPISIGTACVFEVKQMYYGSLVLMNSDGSRWFRFGLETGHVYTVVDSKGLFDHTGSAYTSNTGILGKLSAEYILDVFIGGTLEGQYDLSAIFGAGEPIYAAIFVKTSVNYTYFSRNIYISTYNAAPNVAWGQVASNTILDLSGFLTYTSDELAEFTYYLYFKDKIRNSLNYSDLDSIYAMNPSYASDDFNPLQPGEVCIVIDRYKRVYFYVVKSGSHADSLPDFIKISDTLYWELMEVIQNDEMKVEQHDIVGLEDGTDKLITHVAHNREKSYAPNIQLIHNGVVKTSGITVSVVSNTQLRLTTDEVTAFENLKANVYVTV